MMKQQCLEGLIILDDSVLYRLDDVDASRSPFKQGLGGVPDPNDGSLPVATRTDGYRARLVADNTHLTLVKAQLATTDVYGEIL